MRRKKPDRKHTGPDGTGRFLVAGAPPGHCKLEIDGTTVHQGSAAYGIFTPGVDIIAGIAYSAVHDLDDGHIQIGFWYDSETLWGHVIS